MADWIVFWVIAPISILAAGAMVLARNAVHSALFLIVNFFTLAVFFLVLGSPFLFVVQIIVYAGAIMVLFLFVIMLLGVDPRRCEQGREHPGARQAPVQPVLLPVRGDLGPADRGCDRRHAPRPPPDC